MVLCVACVGARSCLSLCSTTTARERCSGCQGYSPDLCLQRSATRRNMHAAGAACGGGVANVTYRRRASMVVFLGLEEAALDAFCLLVSFMPLAVNARDKCGIEPRRQNHACTCLQLTLAGDVVSNSCIVGKDGPAANNARRGFLRSRHSPLSRGGRRGREVRVHCGFSRPRR